MDILKLNSSSGLEPIGLMESIRIIQSERKSAVIPQTKRNGDVYMIVGSEFKKRFDALIKSYEKK